MASATGATKVIAVIGATGGTGLAVVTQALALNYQVRCLVRNPDSFSDETKKHPLLTVLTGDVKSVNDCAKVIQGATDLVVALGPRPGDLTATTICSEAQLIINHAVNASSNPALRMIVVTSMAVGDSYYDVSWGTRRFADWVIPAAIKDKNLQERSVIRDTTNWVLVRPAGLTTGEVTGKYEFGPHIAPVAYKMIRREDVAHFILNHCLSGKDEWKRYPVTLGPK